MDWNIRVGKQSTVAIFSTLMAFLSLSACAQSNSKAMNTDQNQDAPATPIEVKVPQGMDAATFGNGCFWCTEAVFDRLAGVQSVEPGYSGGHIKNPAYKEVCTGRTGHAEVARIVYDPSVVSYAELLEVFFATHDPTTLNRQGNDVGPQYRSAIFYHSEEQRRVAEVSLQVADESGVWRDPIVTEVSPLINYYSAESYHNDYYENNPEQPYCQYVVRPKVDKFIKQFRSKLKEGVVE